MDDARYMREALELAARGRGFTSPNPAVGAVIVKDGEIVGRGYHERYGGPHAEVNAIAEAGARARGATIYVTLEPCCVWANTPPCVDAVRRAGIRRVVAATEDPNPRVSGGGIRQLRDAGIETEVGLLRHEADELIAPYRRFCNTGLPDVTLKLAMSLDGCIASPPGGARWVSSEPSRERVHAMRAACDCVMVGIGTVLADDPLLTDRRPGASRQPARLLLDSGLRTPPDSALVRSASEVETIVACSEDAPVDRQSALEERGVRVWRCAVSGGRLDLEDVLRNLARDGKLDVISEGGADVACSLLESDLVDRIAFFVAPTTFGPEGLAAFERLGPGWWERARRLRDVRWSETGDDRLLEARVCRRSGAPETSEGSLTCSRAS
jgi:diaminohydroxyphosphoribosylaminopyrimidine deaminase/5-amino-6-(5-phosphoribosylamino)uracil reductase